MEWNGKLDNVQLRWSECLVIGRKLRDGDGTTLMEKIFNWFVTFETRTPKTNKMTVTNEIKKTFLKVVLCVLHFRADYRCWVLLPSCLSLSTLWDTCCRWSPWECSLHRSWLFGCTLQWDQSKQYCWICQIQIKVWDVKSHLDHHCASSKYVVSVKFEGSCDPVVGVISRHSLHTRRTFFRAAINVNWHIHII